MRLGKSEEITLANAHVITPSAAFIGAIRISKGKIVDISEGSSAPADALNCEGDYLLPGLVELHTDNLERHLSPRPGVRWPRRAALSAHDGEFVSVGVTTIFDALRIGMFEDDFLGSYALEVLQALSTLEELGLLKAQHFAHLRCEVCAPHVLEEYDALSDNPHLKLISLMDHTPGQRQFHDISKWRAYFESRKSASKESVDAVLARQFEMQKLYAKPHSEGLAQRAQNKRAQDPSFAVASHDDATAAHARQSAELGANIAEFPTTFEAARASRDLGMKVLMGAPNMLRGRSHSGNVSALDLAKEGLVDVLSSDYAPASLMLAAFKLAEETDYTLPQAIQTVTRTPAQAVGLNDRGSIEIGARADLARVYRAERLCVARAVWRAGVRVM